MAWEQQVKQYLAYWLQLGKKVLIRNGAEALLPKPVIQGDRYSQEFEQCWQIITSPTSGDCYLEGTKETVAELLTAEWDITSCSRCSMPIPLKQVGMPPLLCPCNDLSGWPNQEVPLPRSPIDNKIHLSKIRDRLMNAKES